MKKKIKNYDAADSLKQIPLQNYALCRSAEVTKISTSGIFESPGFPQQCTVLLITIPW